MIRSFTITNHLGKKLVLDLENYESNGILVESVSGLGQVDSKINLKKMAGTDFSSVNQATLNDRDIVFKLQLTDGDSENAQNLLDSIFVTKQMVTIEVHTDLRDCYCTGLVEKNEPDMFRPDSMCNITVRCPDPFFYDKISQTTVFDGIEPLFYFPFSDSGSTEPVDTDEGTIVPSEVQFGEIRIVKDRSVYYTGEDSVGLTIEIHALGPVSGLIIYNLNTNERMGIDDSKLEAITGYGIIEGDTIIINTTQGQKSMTLIRDGVSINIINALLKTIDYDWFKLVNGDNLFTYTAETGEFEVMLSIKNRILYKSAV